MSEPLVSIVTPTLERAVLLEHTIRSLQAQSYRNFEHIVVDGGSGDGTVELLRRVEGSYPLRWISEPDGGMYDAINKGMALAGGEILAYLNSDDLYFPWTLEVVVAAFARQPGADVVYGDAIRSDEQSGTSRPAFQPPFSSRHTAASGSLLQPAVFWRRRVSDHIGPFDDRFRYVADLDFWLRAGRAHRFVRIDEFLALERVHGRMASVVSYGEMADENRSMRRAHRWGIGATFGGRVLGRARAEAWWRFLWLRFVRAARGVEWRGGGRDGLPWSAAITGLRPHVSLAMAVGGLFPGPGMRPQATVRWERDPLSVGAPESTSAVGGLPLVSVITPSFRQARYVRETLRSVHEQDYPEVEHIVVDGGSDDGTLEILRDAEREWGVRWISEPDRGQAHAINKGMAMAGGEIVTWLNADDVYLRPDVVSQVVGRFRAGAQAVTGAGVRMAEDGRAMGRLPLHRSRIDPRTTRYVDWILQPATFFTRRLALAYPLDESLRYALDWDLFIRMGEAVAIEGLDVPIAGYRVHRAGKTVAGGAERQRELLRVLSRYHEPTAWNVRVFSALVAAYGRADRLPEPLAWLGTRTLNALARASNVALRGRGLPT